MNYRAVKANDSNLVLAIGYDEGQGGEDYEGKGVWTLFTFSVIPQGVGEPGVDWHHEVNESDDGIVAVQNV